MRTNTRRFAFALLSSIWLVAVSLCSGTVFAQDSSPTLSLCARSVDNQRPLIAKSPDEKRLFVVWDGLADGRRRVFFRERIAGHWLPETILDSEPEAENCSPTLDIDSMGNLHVAWLGKVGGRYRVFYALRVAETWTPWGVVDGGEGDQDNCEAVTLKADFEGKPWIAWQAGCGNVYSVYCARLNGETGAFDVANLTPGSENYNFYPEIFLEPEATVVWYAAHNADFRLVGQKYDSASRQWQETAIRDMSQMPAKCLPYLLQKSPETLAGLWYDEIDSADRVFFGLQGEETQGAGTIVDRLPDAINHFVHGAVSGDQLLITWCSETAAEGAQVYFTSGSGSPFEREIRVSEGAKDYCAHPRLVGLEANRVAVVWQSSLADGGDGRILFREFAY